MLNDESCVRFFVCNSHEQKLYLLNRPSEVVFDASINKVLNTSVLAWPG